MTVPISAGTVAAVVFDMDGLMLDTESINKVAWQTAARELGHPLDDEFYMTLLGRTTDDCESRVQAHLGRAFPMREFRARRRELWHARVGGEGIATKAGLRELIAFLVGRRVPLAVATSSHAGAAAISLEVTLLRPHFAVVVTGDQVARGKPAPDIYLESARRLGVEAGACVALEDSDNGVRAASAAGMTTLMVPDLKPPSVEAAALAFRVLPSLHEALDALAGWLPA